LPVPTLSQRSAVNSMVQQRTYHHDRQATPAERMRALRARKRNAVGPSVTPSPKRNAAEPISASDQSVAPVVRAVRAHMQKTGMSARKATLDLCNGAEHKFDAKWQAYKRELRDVRTMDRLVNLVSQWGRSEPEWDTAPEAAPRDFVDGWFEIAGPDRYARVGELIDSVAEKWWADDHRKLKQLIQYRNDMKADPELKPRLPTMARRGGKREGVATVSHRLAAEIMKLVNQNPKRHWKISMLSEKLGKTATVGMIGAVVSGLIRSRKLGWIDNAKGLFTVWSPGIDTKSTASRRIVEMLIAAPAGIANLALERAIGWQIGGAVSSLRRRGILVANPSRKEPIRLSADTLDKIARGHRIREGRGAILWEPRVMRTAKLGTM
jgi:hypothetical protein